jgi:hypothetical protein
MPDRHAIIWKGEQFTHREACRVCDAAVRARAHTVIVDLAAARDATTSAFARLVLLRRRLLRCGRDLRIKGLSDRAARLYEVSRLDLILPCDAVLTPAC